MLINIPRSYFTCAMYQGKKFPSSPRHVASFYYIRTLETSAIIREKKQTVSTARMNSRAIFLLLLSFHASAMLPAGKWSPISNVKDPHVVEVGKFAVSEYDMESKSELKFVAVVSGESKVVAGTNYRLIVAVNDGVAGPGASKNYEAIVWEKQWLKSMNLTSFKPVV